MPPYQQNLKRIIKRIFIIINKKKMIESNQGQQRSTNIMQNQAKSNVIDLQLNQDQQNKQLMSNLDIKDTNIMSREKIYDCDNGMYVGSLIMFGKCASTMFRTSQGEFQLKFKYGETTYLELSASFYQVVKVEIILAKYILYIIRAQVADIRFFCQIQAKQKNRSQTNSKLGIVPIRMDIYLRQKIFIPTVYQKQQKVRFKNCDNYQEITARLMVIYLLKKCNAKVITKSFVVPPPKISLLMRDYRTDTIGHRKKSKNRQVNLTNKILSWKKRFTNLGTFIPCIFPNKLSEIKNDFDIVSYYSTSEYHTQHWIPEIFDNEHQLVQEFIMKNKQSNISAYDEQCLNIFRDRNLKQIGADMFIGDQNKSSKLIDIQNSEESVDQQYEEQIRKNNQQLLRTFQEENSYFAKHPSPPQMMTTLKQYQAQALTWLKMRQGKINESQLFSEDYDFLKQFEYERKLSMFWEEVQLPSGSRIFLNHLTGQFSKQFKPGNLIRGGILGDQMGLGKTVMMLSLLADEDFHGTNLVVVPVSVLNQWKKQIAKHCGDKISVLNYNNLQRNQRRQINFSSYHVILISYSTLGSQFSAYFDYRGANQNAFPNLFEFNFRRIILDEAHQIRNVNTQQFFSVMHIRAEFKWCLSGTIIQNAQEDLFAILKFLGIQFFSEERWWNQYIKNSASYQSKLNILYTILRPILLRRTKQNTSLKLPQKYEHKIKPEFSPEQQKVYKILSKGALQQLNMTIGNSGNMNYVYTFSIINKLRDFCCHPKLALGNYEFKDLQNKSTQQIIKQFFSPKLSEEYKNKAVQTMFERSQNCSICFSQPQLSETVLTTCAHIFCQNCIKQWLKHKSGCPDCRNTINESNLIKISKIDEEKQNIIQKNQMMSKIYHNSTKMQKIIEIVGEICSKDQKCVIFTQKINMISILQQQMKKIGLEYATLKGSMSRDKREKQIQKFKNNQNCKIMIVSIRAGGTGLNLQNANNVIICDPWWNPNQQEQAIARVHRLGQQKDVNVYRLYMKNSIEQKIQKLHEKKKIICQQIMMNKQSISKKSMDMLGELVQLLKQGL